MLVGHIGFCYQDRSIMLTLTGFDSMHIACIKQFYRCYQRMEFIYKWTKESSHLLLASRRYVTYFPNLFFNLSRVPDLFSLLSYHTAPMVNEFLRSILQVMESLILYVDTNICLFLIVKVQLFRKYITLCIFLA